MPSIAMHLGAQIGVAGLLCCGLIACSDDDTGGGGGSNGPNVSGSGNVSSGSSDHAGGSSSKGSYSYAEALQKSLLFYELQRSGKLPTPQRSNWRGDSGLSDGMDVGVDLTGGWYDAGDHVKFNLPMAYSAAMLAWSVYEYPGAYEKSGELPTVLGAIRWATDYLMKCHPDEGTYYYQVGDASKDHGWWGPAEAMQMERPAYALTRDSSGSTVLGETAAALAAAAAVMKSTDPAYAETCLAHAKSLFDFAESTKSDEGYLAASGFYSSSSGFYDELSWAAVWIFLASGERSYLEKAEAHVANWGREQQDDVIAFGWGHCWDDVHYGAQLLLAKITGKSLYVESVERNLDFWTTGYEGRRVNYTPKGLAWLSNWGSLRYATTTAFLAGVWADWELCTPSKVERYRAFTQSQVDYALGSTGRSFLVGFGQQFPRHPHHRTAHGSWTDKMTDPAEHRHVLVGALVGGPAMDDSYKDVVDDYQSNEVACDYNAGFVGALASLTDQYGGTTVDNLSAIETPSEDEYSVEAAVNAKGPNFIEIKVLINNRTAWPARVDDELSMRYFFDISELLASGASIADVTVSSAYSQGATVSGPTPLNGSESIYYVTIDFTGTVIYPGGQSAFRKEAQFRISGPQNSSTFDPSNDWSFAGVGVDPVTPTVNSRIPVYRGGVLLRGEEPPAS